MDRGPWTKWTPAVAAAAVVAAVAAGGTIAAGAGPDLPDRTPEEVLELATRHRVEGFSGHLEARMDLGLPPLPTEGAGEAGAQDGAQDGDAVDARLAEMVSLLSGTHRARVFADGHDRFRLQVLDGAEETDVVRNGGDLWVYDSARHRAAHATVPDGTGPGEQPARSLPTPERIADRVLAGARDHSDLTVAEGTAEAGRAAYTLTVDPRTDQTLVESVRIDVDAATGMPLGVHVHAVDHEAPVLSLAFTRFTAETPDAGLFRFRPPAGAAVEELDPGPASPRHPRSADRAPRAGHHPGGEVVGQGWDAVVVTDPEAVPEDLGGSAVLDRLATPVEGGRLLATPVLNVLVTDEGRVVAGAVPRQRLLDVAAGTGTE
ncbi:MAG TPA: hypothetical protein VIG75_11890 [Citricoccus sp.]